MKKIKRQQPKLNKLDVPREDIMNYVIESKGIVVTMSKGQWDSILEATYNRGHILMLVDDNEMPKALYQKTQ